MSAVEATEPIDRYLIECEHCDWSDWETSRQEAVAYGHCHVLVSHGLNSEWAFRVRGYADRPATVLADDIRRLLAAYIQAVPWNSDSEEMIQTVDRLGAALDGES